MSSAVAHRDQFGHRMKVRNATTMANFTPNDWVLMGFVGFWGLVAVGIIAGAAYVWLKDRRSAVGQDFMPRRRRRHG